MQLAGAKDGAPAGGRACCAQVKLLPPGGASRQLWQ